jgi:Tfp pilus assembly major pilin PilA
MSATATDTAGKYVLSVEVTNGSITITYDGTEVNAKIKGLTLGLTPYTSADGSVEWRCGDAIVPQGTVGLMGLGTASVASYIPGTLVSGGLQKYLPAACRQ